MNPLDFLFNGSSSSQQTPWFQGTTQGVSTYSNGINPAALEASVDFGDGNVVQYNLLNTLQIGGIQGIFNQLIGQAASSWFSNFLSGGILGVIFPQYAELVDQAANDYVQSGGAGG